MDNNKLARPHYEWVLEDYERNETETFNAARDVEAFLEATEYTDWFELRQAGLYAEALATGIESSLLSVHEERRERAKVALRQVMALAQEARDVACDALDLEETTEPPGHTCPAIDKTKRAMRRLYYRLSNPEQVCKDNAHVVFKEGLAALEQVREENKQLRRAHADISRKLTSALRHGGGAA